MNNKLLGIGIVAAAFAVIPLFASAQTYATSTVASPPSIGANAIIQMGPGPACPPFSRSLSVGATGSDVTTLQAFLAAHGYLKVSPTGYFGPLTQAAVAQWQANGNVVAQGNAGSGIFGPLSRAFFFRSCGSGPTSPATTTTFSANPQSGSAPLTVQFTSSAPQGSSVGSTVNFGDGSSGTLAFAPTCAGCNAIALVSHTYSASGTYTASLTSGNCACAVGQQCNCPMIQILATTTIAVGPSGSTATSIQQLNAPANVTLTAGAIAEVRNDSYYFTLENLTASSATIQPTQVGCWNSFPSDSPPQVHCMIAVVPTPPQTLSIGQSYQNGNSTVTLTAISNGQATFSVR